MGKWKAIGGSNSKAVTNFMENAMNEILEQAAEMGVEATTKTVANNTAKATTKQVTKDAIKNAPNKPRSVFHNNDGSLKDFTQKPNKTQTQKAFEDMDKAVSNFRDQVDIGIPVANAADNLLDKKEVIRNYRTAQKHALIENSTKPLVSDNPLIQKRYSNRKVQDSIPEIQQRYTKPGPRKGNSVFESMSDAEFELMTKEREIPANKNKLSQEEMNKLKEQSRQRLKERGIDHSSPSGGNSSIMQQVQDKVKGNNFVYNMAAMGVGGALVLNMANNKGQQSNAQLYGQY